MSRPLVLLLGPGREAFGAESTHLNALLASPVLARDFALSYIPAGRAAQIFARAARSGAALVHANIRLEAQDGGRELARVAAARLAGARVLIQVHGAGLPGELGRPLARSLARWTLRQADAIIVPARADAYRTFLPGQRVLEMRQGIECSAYLRHDRPPPEPGAPLRLAFVGRLSRDKGVYELVEAVDRLRARGIAVRLLLAGAGSEEEPLRQRVRELALKREVSLLGALDKERKACLLSLADAFVLPSHREGLPYALLEAMAAGAVPLVTPVGAIPEVVSEGVHGLFVPRGDPQAIADAVTALAADRPALARMSAACRAHAAAAFSIERTAAELRALYASLLNPDVRNRRLDRRGAQRA